jgi:hypothetical protein
VAEKNCTTCGGGSTFGQQPPKQPALIVHETPDVVTDLPTDPAVTAVVMRRGGSADGGRFEFAPALTGNGVVRIVWRGAIALVPSSVAATLLTRDFARLAVADDLPAPPADDPAPPKPQAKAGKSGKAPK